MSETEPRRAGRALGLAAALLSLALAAPASAAVKTWNSSTPGPANDGLRWQPTGTPVPGDTIVFDGSVGFGACQWDLSIGLNAITVTNGYNSQIDFNVPVTVNGPFEFTSPYVSTVNFNAPLTLNGPLRVYSPTKIFFTDNPANTHILGGPIDINELGSPEDPVFHIGGTTVVAIGSMTVANGILEMHDRALFAGTTVFVGTGGQLRLFDNFLTGAPTLTSTGPLSSLYLTVDGQLNVSSAVFGRLDPGGLRLGSGAFIASLSSCVFTGPLQPGSTAINFHAGGAFVSTFTNVSFADSSIAVNVNASLLNPGARVTMRDSSGPRAGPTYENDPAGRVDWVGLPVGASTTRTWIYSGSPPGTGQATNAGNWSPVGVPATGDSVVFNSSGLGECLWDIPSASLNSFKMQAGFISTVTMAAASLGIDFSFEVHAGTFSAMASNVALSGSFIHDGGRFDGGTSTFTFSGSTTAAITALPGSFRHLVVQKLSPGQFLPILSPIVDVLGDLTLKGGTLSLQQTSLAVEGRTLIEGPQSPTLDISSGTAELLGPLVVGSDGTLYMHNSSGTLVLGADADLNNLGRVDIDPGGGILPASSVNYANFVGASTHAFRVNGVGATFLPLTIRGLKSNGVRFEINGLNALDPSAFAFHGVELTNTGADLAALRVSAQVSTSAFFNKLGFGVGVSTNINSSGMPPSSSLIVTNALGTRAGTPFEVDPAGVVLWSPEPSGAPTLGGAPFGAVSSTTLTANWASSFPPGTLYTAQIATASDFGVVIQASQTLNQFALFVNLSTATLYHARVSTNAATGPYQSLGSTQTLAGDSPGGEVTGPAPPLVFASSRTLAGNGAGIDSGRGIATDAAGNLYVTGYAQETAGGRNIWVGKYSPALVLLASATFNGAGNSSDEGHAVAVDGAGSVFVTGYVFSNPTDPDIWLGKFDSALRLVSSATVGGDPGFQDMGHGIAYAGGSVYVAGQTVKSGNEDIWVARYSPGLVLLSSRTVDVSGSNDFGLAVAVDGADLFVAGKGNTAGGNQNIWLGRLDSSSLALLNSSMVDGPAGLDDYAFGVAVQPAGSVFVTGYVSVTAQGANLWLGKFDRTPSLQSQTTFDGGGTDVGRAAAIEGNGHILVAGGLGINSGSEKAWLGAFDTSLVLRSSAAFPGSVAQAYAVAPTEGNVYLAGEFGGDIWTARYATSSSTDSPASLSPGAFTNVSSSAFTASWITSFLPGTVYFCDISTGPLPNNFSGNQSSVTANVLASFANLTPATTYYARVSTNPTTGPFTDLGSVATLSGGGGVTRVWSGAGVDSLASNPANWEGGIAPVSGDSVEFSTPLAKNVDFDLGITLASTTVLAPFASTITVSIDFTNAGNFFALTSTRAAINFGAHSITYGGSIEVSSITFNIGQSTLIFNGSSDQTMKRNGGLLELGHTIVQKPSGSRLVMLSDSKILGDFTLAAGTYTAGPFRHEIYGDITEQAGHLDVAASTVELRGVGRTQTIRWLGGTGTKYAAFYVLNGSTVAFDSPLSADVFEANIPGTWLRFHPDGGFLYTYTFGRFAANGDAGSPVRLLRTETSANPWYLRVLSTASVSYVHVKDSNASPGLPITAVNSLDVGNNVNWIFSGGAASVKIWAGIPSGPASAGSNWIGGAAPQAGDSVVFGSTNPANGCTWDLPIALSSLTFTGSYSGSVFFNSSITVNGAFDLLSPAQLLFTDIALNRHDLNGPVTIAHPSARFHIGGTTVVAVGSVTVQSGLLEMHDKALFKGSLVQVATSGSLRLFDDSNGFIGPPTLTSTSTATGLILTVDGQVNISSAVFGQLSSAGLRIGPSAILTSLSSAAFQGPLLPGTTAINFYAGGIHNSTFSRINFADTSIAVNVDAHLLSAGSRITMSGALGSKAGPSHENDPAGRVDWPGFTEPVPGAFGFFGIAFDSFGNLLAANERLSEVRRYAAPSTATVITEATPSAQSLGAANGISGPLALGFDAGGGLWVSVATSPAGIGFAVNRLKRYGSFGGGTLDTSSFQSLNATLNDVPSIAFQQGSGDLWAANHEARTAGQAGVVRFFNTAPPPGMPPIYSDTSVSTFTFAQDLAQPAALAFDRASFPNLWVASDAGGVIKMYPNSSGIISNSPSVTLSGSAHPLALAFDFNGNLFVSDSDSDGPAGQGFLRRYDNLGTPAQPSISATPVLLSSAADIGGLAFDLSGNLWGSDYRQSTIMRLSTSAPVTPSEFGSISGTLSYSGSKTGTYVIALSTGVRFKASDGAARLLPISSGPFTVSGLLAPNTYYVTGLLDQNFDQTPNGFEPRGRHIASLAPAPPAPVFVAPNATATGVQVQLLEAIAVTGTVTNNSPQFGDINVQAWLGAPNDAQPENLLAEAFLAPAINTYALSLSTISSLYLRAYVDSNNNDRFDSGEDSGVSTTLSNLVAGSTTTANLTIAAGEGGAVFVSAANLAPASLPTSAQNTALLRLGLWTQGGNAQLSSLLVNLAGDAPPANVFVNMVKDSNGDGVFQPGIDFFMGSPQSFGSGLPPQARVQFSTQTLNGTTQYFFLVVDYFNVPSGRQIGLVVDGPSRFGLGTGTMASQALYPIQSQLALIQLTLFANPSSGGYPTPFSSPPTGGLGTGLFVSAGQSVAVTAQGSWGTSALPPSGPDGVAGQFGGLSPGLALGSLVGRVGGSFWFQLGSSVTFNSTQSGELVVAMNDTNYADNTGAVTINASIVESTVTKNWLGGDPNFPTSAGFDSNWSGGQRPFPGDRVQFSSSAFDCFWDIPNITLKSLSVTTSYARVLRLSSPSGTPNTLTVSSSATIAGGTLDLGFNNNLLAVQGVLTVTSSATLDLGSGSRLQTQGLTLSNGAVLRSPGFGFSFMEDVAGSGAWPFLIQNATVAVSLPPQTAAAPTGGLSVRNSSVIDISSSAVITAFDGVSVEGGIPNSSPSVKIRSTAPIARTFQGWSFHPPAVSNNVDASQAAAGSQFTFVNASGGRFGSPYEIDPNNAVFWSPDGGAQGTISGVLSYTGTAGGDYRVRFSTDPKGIVGGQAGPQALGGTIIVSSGAPGYTLTLQAPNTWYIFAFKSVGSEPFGQDPRGGVGNPGSYRSAAMFVAAGDNSTGKNITLKDWGSVSGNLSIQTSQVGPVRLQAWRGDPAFSSSTVESSAFGPPSPGGFYSLGAPPATDYFILGFVDVNNNSSHDSFEASGSSQVVTVTSLTDHSGTDIAIGGGSAASGGTVYLTTAAAHAGVIGTSGPQALLTLRLFSAGDAATFNALQLEYLGAVGPPGASLQVYEDSNGNGVLDSVSGAAPTPGAGGDAIKGSLFLFGGTSSGTAQFFSGADTIVAGSTRTYFVAVDLFGFKVPAAGVKISSSSNFGLAQGSMAQQAGLYPVSTTAGVRFNVQAFFEAFPDSRGGAFTGFPVYKGQTLTIAATGSWVTASGASAVGPAGLGSTGLNTVLPSARVGELIGRLQDHQAFISTPWFRVGTGTTAVAGQNGELILAMNDFLGAYFDGNSGSVLVDFSVSGSTLGAIAGQIFYKGLQTGPLDITATAVDPAAAPAAPTVSGSSKTITITLASATTAYAYAVTDLAPGFYRVTAQVRANASQKGDSVQSVGVVAGSTTTLSLEVFLGANAISGTLAYSGPQTWGDFVVGATTSTDFQSRPVAFAATSTQPAAGAYSIDLAVPNTYYLVAFRDGNFNRTPDFSEAFGLLGSSTGSFSESAQLLTPVFLSDAGGPLTGRNITLTDRGAISGSISLSSAVTSGRVFIDVGRGVPGSPGFKLESRSIETITGGGATAAGAGLFYHVDLLRPATDYSLFAFLDANGNGQLELTEPFFQSGGLSVPAGGNVYLTFALLQAPPPPPVSGFIGSGASLAVNFNWNTVTGASQYELRTATNGVRAVVLHPTSFYADALPPNTSSQILLMTASNVNGTSPPSGLSAAAGPAPGPAPAAGPVFSLAEAPAGLVLGAVTGNSAALSWTASGNPPGTFYELHRATGSAAPATFNPVFFTTATALTDLGLTPNATFFWKVLAQNFSAAKSGFSNQVSTQTPAATVPSIAGTFSYAGKQAGSIIVEAHGTPPLAAALPPLASVTLPNSPSQAYYLSLAGNATYYVRAFVDVTGDRFFSPGEDAGAFGASSAPAAIPVLAGPVTGKNFTIAVDTVPPAGPGGLTASAAGIGQVLLTWAAPTRNADNSFLNDLLGYSVERSTGGAFVTLNASLLPRETLTFTDPAAVAGLTNSYRVRAADYGLNLSPAVAPISVSPSAGGSVSGRLSTFTATTSGLFRIRLASSPAITAGFLAEVPLGAQGNYSFTGLSTGTFYVRAFRDLDNNSLQGAAEPSGTYGGIRTPFPIPIFGGNAVTGSDVAVCDRTPLPPNSSRTGTLSPTDCPAKDKGPGFTTDLYAFAVGDGAAGSIGLGTEVTLSLSAGFDTEIIVLGPEGDIAARDNTPGGASVKVRADRAGVYIVEPTSYLAGASGAYTLSMKLVGGYAGAIAGSVSYSGAAAQGRVTVQLFASAESDAFPIAISTFAFVPAVNPLGNYSFGGLPDGSYYVRAFLDANTNFVKDRGEPSGAFGLSESSPTAITVIGGIATTPQAPLTLTDPAGGTVAGTLIYSGNQSGPMRIEIGTRKCATCEDIDVAAFAQAASTRASTSYALDFIPSATNYLLRAYVDVNRNLKADVLEAKVSSTPVTVAALSTTTVNLLMQDPGAGASGDGTIRGEVFYAGTSTGNIILGFSRDSTFRTIDYIVDLSTQGTFVKSGIVSGTTYYMAGFRDVNGNRNPDDALGEPTGVGAPQGFEGTPAFGSPPPILVPLSGSVTANLTLNDPPNGLISGSVSYFGGAAASANIIVNSFVPGGSGSNLGNRAVISRTLAVTSYAYSLPFLAANAGFEVEAFVDINGNSGLDFGEPFGKAFGPIRVSSGTGSSPASGVDFQILEAGSLGGGLIGQIDGQIQYNGGQGGNFIVRFFTNPAYSGTPSFTAFVTAPAGPGTFSFSQSGLPIDTTFYIDAFRDTAGTGVLNLTYQAYGKLFNGQGIMLDQARPRRDIGSGEVRDPFSGAPTGSRSISGSARYRGNQVNSGAVRALLHPLGPNQPPVAFSSAAFAPLTTFSFGNLAAGSYRIQCFIDANDNFQPDPAEPVAYSTAAGIALAAAGVTGQDLLLCDRAPIAPGTEIFAALTSTDCAASDRNGAAQKMYTFSGTRGRPVSLRMTSTDFYGTFLGLYAPDGTLLISDDGINNAGNALIDGFSLPSDGLYTVGAAAYQPGVTGSFKLAFLGSSGSLGSISGSAAYNGTQGGAVVAGLFRAPDFTFASLVEKKVLAPDRTFQFTGLETGASYYLNAFIDANFNDQPDPGEDSAAFGPGGVPAALLLQAGQDLSGVAIVINSSTKAVANLGYATGSISYTGVRLGTLRVEFWPSGDFRGQPAAVRAVEVTSSPGTFAYDVTVPGGFTYFPRAFLDTNFTFIPDPDEPKGYYSPNNQGAEPLFVPSEGGVFGVDFAIRDPGSAAGAGGVAGEGAAFITPSSAPAGTQLFVATITFTAGASGIQAGGSVGFSIPPGFSFPQFVTVASTSTATLSPINFSGQGVFVTVTAGSVSAGQQIKFVYDRALVPCLLASTQTFQVASAQNASVASQPLFNGSPALSIVPGTAGFFQPINPYFSIKQGELSEAQFLEARDFCGNKVAVSGSAATAALRAKAYDFNSGQFQADLSVGLASATTVSTSSAIDLTFAVGQSSRAFYAYSASTGSKNVELFFALAGPTTFYYGFTVLPGNALSGVSVSTVPTGAGRTLATITPNADPASPNQAFINFTLGDPNLSWRVLVSSIPYKSGVEPTPIWERFGFGQPGPGQVAWDGRSNPWINGGARVANGFYYVRIEVASGLRNDSLVVRVNAPQLSGQIFDAGSTPNPPLSNARIEAFGPFGGGGSSVSDDLGRYVLAGVAGGTYQLFLRRDDYLEGQVSVTLNSSGAVSTFTATSRSLSVSSTSAGGLDIRMNRAPVLVVVPSASGITAQPFDRWGGLQVIGSTAVVDAAAAAAAGQNFFGPLRLKANATVFDDGGQWDPGTQQFVERTLLKFQLAVGTYTVIANFADFSPSSATVFVPAGGRTLNLPAFGRKSTVSGQVRVPSNSGGQFVSVNAVPLSTSARVAGGFGGVFLDPGVLLGTYTVTNLDAGSYILRANAFGLSAVTTGPIEVPVSSDVTRVDFPDFNTGAQISGTVTVLSNTTGSSLQLSVNAWSPGSLNFGSTEVFKAGGASGLTIPYVIKGLDSGATYQMYVNLFGNSGPRLDVAEGLPFSAAAPASNVNFTFSASSGVIAGTLVLPSGSSDFLNVDLIGTVVASPKPEQVGHRIEALGAHTFPGFTCTKDNSTPATSTTVAAGFCPTGNSSATFRIEGLETETDEVTVFYKTTGQAKTLRISVVNGSTTTVFVSLAAETASISGSIVNQITNARYNTNRLIFDNAPDIALRDLKGAVVSIDPAGVPRSTASLARVVATRQDIDKFGLAVSTSFDPSVSRVGFLTAAGTYTITGVPPGTYFVRTADLRDCATCPVLVPGAGQVVRVSSASRTGINFTLSDGFTVSGKISLDDDIQDSRVFSLSVTNRRQEVVRSTTAFLGDAGLGVRANSVDYSFANLPAGDFYTLSVRGTLFPVKYAGRPIKFPDPGLSPNGLQSNLSNQNVTMQRAAYIIGKLRDSNTGELITRTNVSLLASNFQITATANPWIEGGFVVAASSISGRPMELDSQGNLIFRVGPLIPNLTYDVRLGQTRWDPAFLAQGSQNYAPVTLSGLLPQPGEVKDVGVVALSQGQSLTGTVRQSTTTGAALGNIKITAKPSFGFVDLKVETFTNPQGRYTLWVSSAVSNQYDITAAPRDGNIASNGLVYGEVTLRAVNLIATTTADFLLNPLLQKVTGQVVVEDAAAGGELSYPFGDKKGFPAAALNLQPAGVIAVSNPLGDIEESTDESGRFEILGLSTGTYNLQVASLGYGVLKATVTTAATGYRIYTGSDTPANYLPSNVLTLRRGATVTGRIAKSDGSAPNDTEVGGVAAANFAQNEFVIGSVDVDDSARTVNSYTISGFKTGIDYDIVVLPKEKGDDINFPPEGSGISFGVDEATTTKTINLTFLSSGFDCVPASKKALGNNQFQIRIECSKPLRKKVSADDDLNSILTVSTFTSKNQAFTSPDGTGQMLGGDKELSGNRRKITAIYRAVTGEANFGLRLRAFSSEVDPTTGENFFLDKVFDFFVGLDSNATKKISNIQGGQVELEPTAEDEAKGLSERATLNLNAGTFAEGKDDASSVAVASKTVDVSISKGKDQKLAKTLALKLLGYAPAGLEVLDKSTAFPDEMSAAIKAYRLMAGTDTVNGANPLSSFYSIFLPAGIRHQLKEKADLTLSYTTLTSTGTDPDKINVWFYNATLGRFVLETVNRRVDTVNKTITVSIDHLSTFVVLDSTPVLSVPNVVHVDSILAANFPNPADCITHSNISRNNVLFPSGGTHAPFRGTMMRVTLPGTASQVETLKLNIYSVSGELVRTLDAGRVAGDATHYLPWDCSNESGRTVSSGVYIGEAVWKGKRKLFKMAIIKGSGL